MSSKKIADGEKSVSESGDEVKSYAGIPEAQFVENVDAFMTQQENNNNTEAVLRRFDEQHSKYKFMEINLLAKRRRLKTQIPDLENSLEMITLLTSRKESPDETQMQFLLSDQVYMKARIPPTDKVCLWLGANVMLEYVLEDAAELLQKNMEIAKRNLEQVSHDLDFLRDQFTTTEVNMARVYNWDVKRRQAEKAVAVHE